MKQPTLDLKMISAQLGRWFSRFHIVIFFLVIGLSLIFCIYVLLATLNESSVIDQASVNHVDTQFDTQTMQRVNGLNNSNSDAPLILPSGRTNPFVE